MKILALCNDAVCMFMSSWLKFTWCEMTRTLYSSYGNLLTVCLVLEFRFQNLKERVLPMMISKGKEGDKTVVVLVVSLTQSAPCGTAPLYTKVYIVIEHQQHNSYDDFGKLGS